MLGVIKTLDMEILIDSKDKSIKIIGTTDVDEAIRHLQSLKLKTTFEKNCEKINKAIQVNDKGNGEYELFFGYQYLDIP